MNCRECKNRAMKLKYYSGLLTTALSGVAAAAYALTVMHRARGFGAYEYWATGFVLLCTLCNAASVVWNLRTLKRTEPMSRAERLALNVTLSLAVMMLMPQLLFIIYSLVALYQHCFGQ